MTAQEYLEERKVEDIACGVRDDGEFLLMSDMMNEFAYNKMLSKTGDFVQFISVELTGKKYLMRILKVLSTTIYIQ